MVPLLVTAGLVAAGGYWYFADAVSRPLSFNSDLFVIAPGDNLNKISRNLVDAGITREPWSLRLLAKKQGGGSAIQAGEYELPKSLNLQQFLHRIVNGIGQIDVRVTVLEGWTFSQMRSALAEAEKLNHETINWSDAQIMEAMGQPGVHPEGQFYPDTYYYRANDSDLVIYRKAHDLMQKKLADVWQQRQPGIQIETPYEALILASIIEKETWVPEEQPRVAGVFMNRLKKGMRLQTDPTVIYGVGAAYDGDITRQHLKTDTPYNTYTRSGLTPTPISLPGEDSLLAAVDPEKTDAYYFVAMGGGRHKFSKTLEEHNRAVRKYILGKSE